MERDSINVGVVGATGLVGERMLAILAERDFPVEQLHLYASSQSAGKEISWQGKLYTVEDAARTDFAGIDIALFSAGAKASLELAPKAAAAGAVVIDNSSAWRMDPEVPLVVAGVNDEGLANIPKGIVANPNCTTMIAMPVLKPLHDLAGLEAMVVATYQAASGAGYKGIYELNQQFSEPVEDKTQLQVFPAQLADNVIPLRGNLVGRDTDEEQKLLHESQKILSIAHLAVSATCVSVSVREGHSFSVEARFCKPISPDMAEEVLSQAVGVEVVDIPTPLSAVGGDVSQVGRIRQSNVFGRYGLSLFIAGDNLRKGATLNAVQLAELVTAQ